MWIYKHKLFHRDRPEDLHQVRRRTCPGVDGRKQRFSRFSAQKLSNGDDDKGSQSSEESSLEEDTIADELVTLDSVKKRRGSLSSETMSVKRNRRLWGSDEPLDDSIKVDTSILPQPFSSPSSVPDPPKSLIQDVDEEEMSAVNKKTERMEMLEHSTVVSEVAMKLEEYVRKAMRGRGANRARRAGIVTPPYGSSSLSKISCSGLITYDDEYDEDDFSGVVTDGDDSLNSGDISVHTADKSTEDLFVAPVPSEAVVQRIVEDIQKCASSCFENADLIYACAHVAELLMSNPPGQDIGACCSKVSELLSKSDRLAQDFHFYRAALRPESAGDKGPSQRRFQQEHVLGLRRALESGSTRNETLREFKIFAVNLLHRLLGKNGRFDMHLPLSNSDRTNLRRAADAWSKSVSSVA